MIESKSRKTVIGEILTSLGGFVDRLFGLMTTLKVEV